MVQKAELQDVHVVAELALLLWEDNTLPEMEAMFTQLLSTPEAAVFLAYCGGETVGFAQCQLRHDYVEGTDSSPVGYLEGIFIKEPFRHRGYARMLLAQCEVWAKEMGCAEFASDCELENSDSLAFHLRVGFAEAGRIICFTKKL